MTWLVCSGVYQLSVATWEHWSWLVANIARQTQQCAGWHGPLWLPAGDQCVLGCGVGLYCLEVFYCLACLYVPGDGDFGLSKKFTKLLDALYIHNHYWGTVGSQAGHRDQIKSNLFSITQHNYNIFFYLHGIMSKRRVTPINKNVTKKRAPLAGKNSGKRYKFLF